MSDHLQVRWLAYQRELDGVERVGGEDLVVESRVDHGGLGPVRAHQVHRLRVVLLPPASVLAHQFSWNKDC